MKRFLLVLLSNTSNKGSGRTKLPLRKGNTGMGQSGLCFIDTSPIIFCQFLVQEGPSLSSRGGLVSRTALPDPACVHGCACSMCNSSPQTHTSRHTQTDIVHGQKTLRSFFFQTRIQLVTDRTRFQDWSWMFGMQLNYFNAEKPFQRHRKVS